MTTNATTTSPRRSRREHAAEVLRYLIVGGGNTAFGLGTFYLTVHLLSHFEGSHVLGLLLTQAKLAMAASVITTPINITVSYFNYKLFVFRTRGNILREWLKAFSVYGASMLVGLAALGALTRGIQILLHDQTPFGRGSAASIAGTLMTFVTTVISYFGHKKVTFGNSPTPAPDRTEHPIV